MSGNVLPSHLLQMRAEVLRRMDDRYIKQLSHRYPFIVVKTFKILEAVKMDLNDFNDFNVKRPQDRYQRNYRAPMALYRVILDPGSPS